ncbi:hypothetical protein Ddye_011588 [Dipteronia dyeriana]|uniref:Uncharacterized protein n=1 Tax=Dipteronia dyeriana TaxID=168575 RepID=A0AAE0CHA0_9ROSI|nr:hypothetical protein Ddye_011588 [Dipteronia dyeriana]
MPIVEDRKRVDGILDLPSKEEEKKKNGINWGMPNSNKYWKGGWFFVGDEWGRNPSGGSSDEEFSVPRHFCDAITESDMICGKVVRVLKAVQLSGYHDEGENVKLGNAHSDDPDLIKDSDSHVPISGVVAAGSGTGPGVGSGP